MREFVIGDLHGSIDLLNKLLLELDFDFNEDIMYSVGDLIDRGTDSIRCLRLLKEPWFKAVRGNHEQFLIDTILYKAHYWLWLNNGGAWHLKEDKEELIELAKLAESLPYARTIGNIGICHAQPPTLDWNDTKNPNERNKDMMLWSRDLYQRKKCDIIKNIEHVFVGHTIVQDVEQFGNVTFIDTGAFYYKNLTCMEITNEK